MSKILLYFIAVVWFASGFFCKVLGLEPRHKMIVATILGQTHAGWLTVTIGILEMAMSVWVLSRIAPRVCALSQLVLVIIMNLLEVTLCPDLLLFGYWNLLPGFLFVSIVAYREFVLLPKMDQTNTAR